MKCGEKREWNGDERLRQMHSVKCVLCQIRQLLSLNTNLNKRKSGQTYKDIHEHVLQRHL